MIGDPARHSLSPRLHNAAYRALGLDWAYLAFEVPGGRAGEALDAMRALGLGGLNVTMPHKAAVAGLVAHLSDEARALVAVNTVVPTDGGLAGHNTDGAGFLLALREEGVEPEGRRILVLGAGGAARAVVHALAVAGAGEVVVVARRREAAAAAARLGARVGTAEEADGVDVVVNATPVGMGDDRGMPVDGGRLGRGQLVVDLVYEPRETPLLAEARRRGARAANGVGMLVHQAALAFQLFTGEEPPVEVMRSAVPQPFNQGGGPADRG